MNECAMLHIPDSRYCFATGEKELVLRLRMAREDEKAKVFLIYAQKYDFTFCRKKLPMEIKYSDRLYNYYEIKMRLEDVRFAYIFQIEEDGNTWYFSEDGVTKEYKFEEAFYNFFQMPYINKNDVMDTVDWMRSAVFYQIFVERFRQGNEKKDTSYINMKWDEKPTPKSFAGGDLAGIIEKMDYLKELGISALYLTPVFRSISNHKYDIIDYFTVDPQFGTKEELRQLVKLAHENGIRVVLDAVFNHCSMEMQQFQDVLEKGRESRFYDWFIIDGDFPEPEKMNYECFAACNYMPKLNTANEEVQDFLLEIAIYWIREADIDGWRLDVSDEVSHGFWRRFRKAVKKEKPDSVIIGENWHDAYAYLMGDQYDSIMNYAFTKACLDYFAKGVFSAKDMADKLNSNLMRNTEQVNRMMLNLLDSHDTHRFFTEVNKDKDKMLAAIALEMVFEGAPCLYYGTELCMEGGYDPDSRRGFPWDTKSWDMDFLEKVKELIRIRKQPAVQYGEIKIEEEQEMLHVERMWENSKIILRINMTEEEKKIPKQPEETVLCEDNRFLITITEA
ncbi:MAG: glycoside hydrolase family 13 protein [Lachnospiraceae bacterium]|nr:glycoside hydrolase family 13 protein [Lachnospiraceae bacterium]MDY6155652.1 glycoside hydrolase family 13 protein [Agathobacter sp.]